MWLDKKLYQEPGESDHGSSLVFVNVAADVVAEKVLGARIWVGGSSACKYLGTLFQPWNKKELTRLH